MNVRFNKFPDKPTSKSSLRGQSTPNDYRRSKRAHRDRARLYHWAFGFINIRSDFFANATREIMRIEQSLTAGKRFLSDVKLPYKNRLRQDLITVGNELDKRKNNIYQFKLFTQLTYTSCSRYQHISLLEP